MTIEPKVSRHFEIGEQVRVSDGPFTSFYGTAEEVGDDGQASNRTLPGQSITSGESPPN
jgi:transcription antitermination factor NusG